jgi:hypothetical protein
MENKMIRLRIQRTLRSPLEIKFVNYKHAGMFGIYLFKKVIYILYNKKQYRKKQQSRRRFSEFADKTDKIIYPFGVL